MLRFLTAILNRCRRTKPTTNHSLWPTHRPVAEHVCAEVAASLKDQPHAWAISEGGKYLRHRDGVFWAEIPDGRVAATLYYPPRAAVMVKKVELCCTRKQSEAVAQAVAWWLAWNLNGSDHPMRRFASQRPADNGTPESDNGTPANDADLR